MLAYLLGMSLAMCHVRLQPRGAQPPYYHDWAVQPEKYPMLRTAGAEVAAPSRVFEAMVVGIPLLPNTRPQLEVTDSSEFLVGETAGPTPVDQTAGPASGLLAPPAKGMIFQTHRTGASPGGPSAALADQDQVYFVVFRLRASGPTSIALFPRALDSGEPVERTGDFYEFTLQGTGQGAAWTGIRRGGEQLASAPAVAASCSPAEEGNLMPQGGKAADPSASTLVPSTLGLVP